MRWGMRCPLCNTLSPIEKDQQTFVCLRSWDCEHVGPIVRENIEIYSYNKEDIEEVLLDLEKNISTYSGITWARQREIAGLLSKVRENHCARRHI